MPPPFQGSTANDPSQGGIAQRSPVVCCVSTMKDRRPVRMVLTLHMGFHVSGWKSDMLRVSRVAWGRGSISSNQEWE